MASQKYTTVLASCLWGRYAVSRVRSLEEHMTVLYREGDVIRSVASILPQPRLQ